MRKWNALVAIVVVSLLAGCTITVPTTIVGSGRTTTVEEDLTGFSKVNVGSAFRVDISQSDDYSVSLEVDEKVVPYLDVGVQGDTLRIRLKPTVTLGGVRNLEAKITMPELAGLNLSGAARGTVTGFKSDGNLGVELSGASRLEGDIEAGDVSFDLSGASRVELNGKGGNMKLGGSGASNADLSDFQVNNASVELSGASRATVNVSGKLDIEASGASHLGYLGNPTMGRVDTSGASSIQPQ